MLFFFFFFFKQKTAYEMRISDWSSDVCSSDLLDLGDEGALRPAEQRRQHLSGLVIVVVDRLLAEDDQLRPFLLDHRLQQLGDSQRLRVALALDEDAAVGAHGEPGAQGFLRLGRAGRDPDELDRKSTPLNSSHEWET